MQLFQFVCPAVMLLTEQLQVCKSAVTVNVQATKLLHNARDAQDVGRQMLTCKWYMMS